MDAWIKTLKALIRQLDHASPAQGSVEHQSVGHLKTVMAAAEQGNPVRVNHQVAVLRTFWLNSVAWCSQLSKDIETILIQYEENDHHP